MKQKAITGDAKIGKKHIIILSLINLVPLILFIGACAVIFVTDIMPDLYKEMASITIIYGLYGLFFTILGFVLILLKVNIARIITETVYLCVGIGVMIFYFLAPIMIPYLLFSTLCLVDFAVLFFDKNIYAYCHSRGVQDKDAETGKILPLI